MNQEILNPVHNELDPPHELSKLHDESFDEQNKDEENDTPLSNFISSDAEKNDQRGPSKNITSGAAQLNGSSHNENNTMSQNEPLQNENKEEYETLGQVL